MLDISTLIKLNRPIPRYTSYPTAPQFKPVDEALYKHKLSQLANNDEPISLYIHIPFCRSMCLFCACAVTLNRSSQKQSQYLEFLHKEIRQLRSAIGKKLIVDQLHFGGGTPTNLTEQEFSDLMRVLDDNFDINYSKEVSIEIDPRTVCSDEGKKLKHLQSLGFNRVSFGVQDTNQDVQEAVKRRQSYEMTKSTFELAKELNFSGINIDLIYGLPKQTPITFKRTTELICEMQPDRIALFSYAKVPWLKPHQKAIADEDLPVTRDKFQIYIEARDHFLQSGYVGIGMDHFSLKSDSLAKAFCEKKLYRNFQGYSICFSENMLGLGNSAIGYVEGMYVQNIKEVKAYEEALSQDSLAAGLGKELNFDDLVRKWVIQKIMCDFCIDKQSFAEKFDLSFDEYFSEEKHLIEKLLFDDLVEEDEGILKATELGCLFIRNVACVFDRYYQQKVSENMYSRSV